MPSNSSLSELRQLSNLISESITKIEEAYSGNSLAIPSLDDLFNPQNPSEVLSMDPEVVQSSNLVIAASAQLQAILMNPALSIVCSGLSFHLSSCLRVVSALSVVEVLRDGPKSEKEIGAICNTDHAKLARCLRLLASHHIFKEVSPDVFANNRLSSVLEKGKPVEELIKNSPEKFDETSGISALLEHITDEAMKSSSYLADILVDPKIAFIEDPHGAPFLRAHNTSQTIWEWFEQPENAAYLRRFGIGQAGINAFDPPTSILTGFQWSSLPTDSILVDVGGGIGSKSIVIAKKFPELSVVVQDRAATIEQAKAHWAKKAPDAKVQLQAHDFFQPQPIKNATIFLLRCILHDWADAECMKILKQLRDAATPSTKLVIIEKIVPYACESDEKSKSIINAVLPSAPAPLLPNFGAAANGTVYWSDLHMMTLFNATERTIGGFIDLCAKSGWRIEEVFHLEGPARFSEMVAVPI